jgi:hypothetical protein
VGFGLLFKGRLQIEGVENIVLGEYLLPKLKKIEEICSNNCYLGCQNTRGWMGGT